METDLLLWLLILPLSGFLINGLVGKKINNEAFSGFLGLGVVAICFGIVINLLLELMSLPAEGNGSYLYQNLFNWMSVGDFKLDFTLVADRLTIVPLLLITGIGSLIHLYSIGYMHGDEGFSRFFAYLNLFIVSMLVLVLGDSLPLMFIGWEGVGLCSYLLIGFWYETEANAIAAKKAFITNRVGDFGFLLGIFTLWCLVGGLGFSEVNLFFKNTTLTDTNYMFASLAALALFIGATGKSAQIPLYVWLPDAMAGPTPVSALIHAATMVTAGIYMMARLNGLFFVTVEVMQLISFVGAATALFAATIGLVQNDIKKVLAYSTVSQLGFMAAAIGVGAWHAAIFHLMTHAFFKACLFLGAGSVIHGMHHEQDMRKMGGLRKQMPQTFVTFLTATLAIAGVPFFAGFFSKDEILWLSFASARGSVVVYVMLTAAALCTAFYMFRIIYLTFLGKGRMDHHTAEHVHESPWTMTLPLWVLAILSCVGGWVGIPHLLGGGLGIENYFEHWLEPIFAASHVPLAIEDHSLEAILMGVAVAVATLAISLAHLFYGTNRTWATVLAQKLKPVHGLLMSKYWIDEVYAFLIVRPLVKISDVFFLNVVDRLLIDGLVNGVGGVFTAAAGFWKSFQNGNLQRYVLVFLVGLALAMVMILGSL